MESSKSPSAASTSLTHDRVVLRSEMSNDDLVQFIPEGEPFAVILQQRAIDKADYDVFDIQDSISDCASKSDGNDSDMQTDSDAGLSSTRRRRRLRRKSSGRPRKSRTPIMLEDSSAEDDLEAAEEDEEEEEATTSRRSSRLRSSGRHATLQNLVAQKKRSNRSSTLLSADSGRRTRATRSSNGGSGFQILRNFEDDEDDDDDEDDGLVGSDLTIAQSFGRGRRQGLRDRRPPAKKRKISMKNDDESSLERRGRRSGRNKHVKGSMAELGEDDIDEVYQEVAPRVHRVAHEKELFDVFDKGNDFVRAHRQVCDTCREGPRSLKDKLIYCQGCSTSYHQQCIGPQSAREHLVTKCSETQFVLQCRRCIDAPRKKDKTAPRGDVCTECRGVGNSSQPFSKAKKLTATDKTITPVDVPEEKINRLVNVLFRCRKCVRAYHFNHLPKKDTTENAIKEEDESTFENRLREYGVEWLCLDCHNAKGKKISSLLAWRPSDPELKQSGIEIEYKSFSEDEKEYLVHFVEESYFRAKWCPGAWVHGFAAHTMLAAYAKKDHPPQWTSKDAIPEECLRVDIVFDIEYNSIVSTITSEAVDKMRIKEVKKALVKYKGLSYEESVWESPPLPEEEERYADFKKAYESYVRGNHLNVPNAKNLRVRLEEFRAKEFKEIKKQPKYLVGGELKDYQLEGVNWLYYKWYSQNNAILADEMGLGKTIQIVSFLSVLAHEHKCWPFLIVAPHSTVPNWKREINKWAPGLRAVAYYGSGEARGLTRKYEMFRNVKDYRELNCHVVITSYQTPVDDASYLRQLSWESLIVDEGQRLKSDESQLYNTLSTFNVKHKVLLTGTPLQNNTRELFNLLQFLDPKRIDANILESKFEEVTSENLPELRNLIRPFFLRRTKALALKDLPPLSEVIVPVTMTSLQRKVYKSILEKDAELIRAIMYKSGPDGKLKERTKLGHILVQLRKVLCHPFVFSQDLEENLASEELIFRNLVDASAKLKLLEIMLPKLQAGGHRVLIFSQFLGMLDIIEDFLKGMNLMCHRLDGQTTGARKQQLIDEFNAPDSPYFAFLLSTKAGGVGINLATADTVIIYDPDFNPHNDLQAISRVHRIGQVKKVLVFHFMTANCAEERIFQLARKKLSLDHLIIQRMDKDEGTTIDVESVLKYGAKAIFEDTLDEIKYDNASVDKLLDRSQIEETPAGEDNTGSADAQFSFAKVWANSSGKFEDAQANDENDANLDAPDTTLWDKIIEAREAEAAREKALREQELGRGRRNRGTKKISYAEDNIVDNLDNVDKEELKKALESDNDTDFRASSGDDTEAEDGELRGELPLSPQDAANELADGSSSRRSRSIIVPPSQSPYFPPGSHLQIPGMFPRGPPRPPGMVPNSVAQHTQLQIQHPRPVRPINHPAIPQSAPLDPVGPSSSAAMNGQYQYHGQGVFKSTSGNANFASQNGQPHLPSQNIPTSNAPIDCPLCSHKHRPGKCPMRKAPIDNCPLCGIPHLGVGPVCPHLGSETQISLMLDALKQSNEDPMLVKQAVAYLRGRKAFLNRNKREKKAKMEREAAKAKEATSDANKQPPAHDPHQDIDRPNAKRPTISNGSQAPGAPELVLQYRRP